MLEGEVVCLTTDCKLNPGLTLDFLVVADMPFEAVCVCVGMIVIKDVLLIVVLF